MGRHPYAGRGGGDSPLDQLIARNLFAYSRNRANGTSPPVGMATLGDFPPEIADAFERAFGPDRTLRPRPEEWIGLLQGLEGRLSRCGLMPMHLYPSAAKGCPWCRMEEASSGLICLSRVVLDLRP